MCVRARSNLVTGERHTSLLEQTSTAGRSQLTCLALKRPSAWSHTCVGELAREVQAVGGDVLILLTKQLATQMQQEGDVKAEYKKRCATSIKS